MSRIIFLNGCSSSGKSSIAKAIQQASTDLWLTLGIDTFIDLLPKDKEDSYLKFIHGLNENGPTTEVQSMPEGAKLFKTIPQFAALLAHNGHNIIIDEVIFDKKILEMYAEQLKNHTTYSVGIFCNLKVMQEREIMRKNRILGLSNDQITRVHQGATDLYDLKMDTSHITPLDAAHRILGFIKENPNPQAFSKITALK